MTPGGGPTPASVGLGRLDHLGEVACTMDRALWPAGADRGASDGDVHADVAAVITLAASLAAADGLFGL